ncbi:MAG: DNA polymerase III, subunit gamma and tau, partial [Desulfovibrio sp.]|nr:DNA polymerase III, subunit gamma and tau [Desulfovibrio sp.]
MASLTAKYRPRLFAEVAGQDAVRAILSRAAATGKIAPAYMFSGTRGVGKTTIARIFAKALNCEQAPAPEPCNVCSMCRQATQGTAVDIIEIDAASHGGVNDVRALKEDVGYAPLEGRYKIFIIDEAHMLSTAAFNALLKTLEEPPARVTFILASTEAHKFPATILSRCQHYVFKMLPQADLAAHLEG